MAESLPRDRAARHLLLPDRSTAPLKADLRKAEIDWKLPVGSAIERMRALCGLTLKELAAALDRDERQIARWIAGTERPQLDAILAVEVLRQPIVIALAEVAQQYDALDIETTIRIRRRA